MARMAKDWNARFESSKPVRLPPGLLTVIAIFLIPVCFGVSGYLVYVFSAGATGPGQRFGSNVVSFAPILLPLFLIYLDLRPRPDNKSN